MQPAGQLLRAWEEPNGVDRKIPLYPEAGGWVGDGAVGCRMHHHVGRQGWLITFGHLFSPSPQGPFSSKCWIITRIWGFAFWMIYNIAVSQRVLLG